MKATFAFVCVILGVWICGAYCSEVSQDNSVEFAPEVHNFDVSQTHHRTRRSPLDPVVAPLLIGKSFLYGALIGPKLFKPYVYHRPYYHHYHYPIHHYPKFYGYGHGHGYGGHLGGYGYGR